MRAAAGGLHHIDETAHGGVVTVGPPHGDVNGALSCNLLRMQLAAVANGLGFFNVSVFASNAPNVGNGFTLGQVVHEIPHATGMAEFLDTGMRVFRFLRLCHSIGFHRLTCDGIFSIAAFVAFLRLRIVIRYRFPRLRNFLRSFKILRFVIRSIRNIVDFQHFIDGFIAGFRNIFVDDGDFQSRHQETGLPDTVDQLLVAEFCGIVENLRISPVTDAGTGSLRTDLANDLEFGRTVLARALERRVRRRMLRIDVGIYTRMTLME